MLGARRLGNKKAMDPRPNIALVPVEHDLDVTTVDSLRGVVDGLIASGCRRIILNMAGATYVDSAGMALVLCQIRRMRELGGLISLVNASDQVLAIFRRARVVDFVPVSGKDRTTGIPELDPATQPLWRTVVPIDATNLALTRSSVSRLLERVRFSPDERFDANLAVGEAMGNAVDHACADGAFVTVIGYPDRAVVEVADCGCGFDASVVEATDIDPHSERGRGIRLMRLLADSVTIAPRSSGTGMVVRIVKLAHASLS